MSVFKPVDVTEIEKISDNGGIAQNTKDRRKGCINKFNGFQKDNGKPLLAEICSNLDKEELENDLKLRPELWLGFRLANRNKTSMKRQDQDLGQKIGPGLRSEDTTRTCTKTKHRINERS